MATTLLLAKSGEHHQNFTNNETRIKQVVKPLKIEFIRQRVNKQNEPIATINTNNNKYDFNNNVAEPNEKSFRQQSRETTTTAARNKTAADKVGRNLREVPNCSQELLDTARGLLLREYEQHGECFFEADMKRLLSDDWFLTRFLLRCKKDARLTINLIKQCGHFRHEYNVHPDLTYKDFPMEFFTLAGIFPYQRDRFGNQTLIMRIKVHNPQLIAKLDLLMELKRFLLYSMEQSDRLNEGRGIAVVFDMSDASLSNLDWDLLTWMVGSFKQYCPKVVSYILVYNLSWFLNGPMKLASSTLLTNSNR